MNSIINYSDKENLKVVFVASGRMAKKKLASLGIVPGVIIQKKRVAPFLGPVIIFVKDSEIVLGLGLAKKIIVEKATKMKKSVPCKVLRKWIDRNRFGKYVKIDDLEALVEAYEKHHPRHAYEESK